MFISGKKLCVILSVIGSVLAGAKDECGFVNTLFDRNEGYDCCANGYPNIKCSADHITFIDLSDNNIEKALPSKIENLPNLTKLVLKGNKLSGSFPDVSALTSLTHLDMSNNQIEGTIPDSIEKLTNLKTLDVSNNKITGFSEKITTLPLLTDLILSNNNIDGEIPKSINSFKNLKTLDLSGNKLSGKIPDEITKIISLISLNLSNNSLNDKIPDLIGDLILLRFIDLSNNSLTGEIPTEEFEGLQNLATINLSGNHLLTGKSPNVSFDSPDYSCNYENTNLCYISTQKNDKCKYSNYDCHTCKEEATVVGDICRCNAGYSGTGYVLCTQNEDSNLNNESESAGYLRSSLQSLTIATIVLLASYVLYFM